MNDSDKYEPPQPGKKDQAVAVVRAAIASIPVAGSAAVELMPLLFTAPLERRRQLWMNEIADAVRELQENRGVTLEQLQVNESFISVLVQATQAAIRNHHQAKMTALRNVVINSASGIKIDEDLQLLFVRFVDELAPSHLALLRFFRDKESEFEKVESYEHLFEAFREIGTEVTRDEFRLICEELKTRNLIRISNKVDDFHGVAAYDYIVNESETPGPALLVTEIGRNMLDFIADLRHEGSGDSAVSSTET